MVCVAFAAVVFAGLVLSGIVGCKRMAETSKAVGRKLELDEAQRHGVRKLFTYDGCTVYAFNSFNEPSYFANCVHGSVTAGGAGGETPTAYDVPRGTSVP